MEKRAVYLRPAHKNDCKLIWEWANDPDVRQASFSSDLIDWQEHVRWFTKKLNDPDYFQFIALDGHNPVGQIRFDMYGHKAAKIGVSVNREKRGLEYGTLLIEKGIEEVTKLTQVNVFHAFVKIENKASIRAFEKAGFEDRGIETVEGVNAVHLAFSDDGNRDV